MPLHSAQCADAADEAISATARAIAMPNDEPEALAPGQQHFPDGMGAAPLLRAGVARTRDPDPRGARPIRAGAGVLMRTLVAIAAGGALGSVARCLGGAAVHLWLPRTFPGGTLAVNVLGCTVIGVLWVWLAGRARPVNRCGHC